MLILILHIIPLTHNSSGREFYIMDFKHIPKKYRPIPFWSWNEKLDKDETVEQIEKMENVGIGGFFMHARGGLQTEYMGEQWFQNVDASIRKCEENGMHPWAYDENGWPSGFGGGLVCNKGIEYQQKYLRFKEGETESENTIINKSGYNFYYDVNPFYVDTLNAKVIKCFLDEIYEPYYEKFKGRLDGFFTDEPQISRNGIPWSFTIPEEYEKAYGENILDRLIELFKPVGDYKATRIKFYKLITELFSKNFMKQIYDWCEGHGFKFTGHLSCEEDLYDQLVSNGACMPHYEYFSVPGMDWLGRHNEPSLTPYQVASAASQAGKKQVLSETYALCGHNVGHDELKWIYEFQMVRGINLLCQHLEGYSNRGLRKRDYPPAMYIQQPWWDEYKMFNDAMSRIGMLLSDGDDGIDVLVIHPQTTAWTMYDDTQKCKKGIQKYSDYFIKEIKKLERKHINFHLGDEIMMERHGHIDGKYFVIGEKKYSKVIIPKNEVLFDNTIKLLDEYKANDGVITTFDEIVANDIIDVPEITYCERHYGDLDMYYFVNSTENTYNASIKKGNKVMDITSGELYDFDGVHTFRKYESLVVIDEHKERVEKTEEVTVQSIDLDGEWEIVNTSENSLTLDYCDYYFDGVLEEKDGYVLNAMYRALERKGKTHIKMEYKVKAEYIPEKLYLAVETPEIFSISINGKKLKQKKCGYFRDKSFQKLDISGMISLGENIISVEVDFEQSDVVYENIEKSKIFESEKNKLTFDMEIEAMYLVGDFSVRTDGEYINLEKNVSRYRGDFAISEPKKTITLEKIERQGFPFFAGEIAVKKVIDKSNAILDFSKCGINVVKVKINGEVVKKLMWEPYMIDLSSYLNRGENELELSLINNLRNLLGPHHLAEGETYLCGPHSFYKEKCIWMPNAKEENWNRDYCLAEISVVGKEQL